MRTAALILALMAVPAAGWAVQVPRPGPSDPRIQSVDYDPDQVVLLQGAIGNQIMLEFAPGERLENVAIGDALGWQVTPNKRADLLFVKPLDANSVTNMTVVTDQRQYVFELRVAPKKMAALTPYTVRFIYPAPAVAMAVEPAPETPPQVVNSDYEQSGSDAIRASRIFDDGHAVYFQWPADMAAPAIFAVGADKSESLVNYVMRGDYVVVEQLSPRFVLRSGKQAVTIVDRAFAPAKVAGNGR